MQRIPIQLRSALHKRSVIFKFFALKQKSSFSQAEGHAMTSSLEASHNEAKQEFYITLTGIMSSPVYNSNERHLVLFAA